MNAAHVRAMDAHLSANFRGFEPAVAEGQVIQKRPLQSEPNADVATVAAPNGGEPDHVHRDNGNNVPITPEPAPTLAEVEAEIEVALAAGELSLQDKFALFERRLKAALTDSSATITAATLEKLLHECDNAIAAAQQEAIDARERGLDFVASPDIKAAREAVDDAEFFVSRLLTQRPRLAALLDARRAQEQRAQYLARYEQLKSEGAALAQELAEIYPALVGPLVGVFTRIRAFEQQCSALHQTDPGSMPHVVDPELQARGLAEFSRDLPSLLESVRLSDWRTGKEIWPPRSGDFAASFAASMTVPSAGPFWSDESVRARIAAERQRENERMALHAQRAAKEQEQRQNRQLRDEWEARNSRV